MASAIADYGAAFEDHSSVLVLIVCQRLDDQRDESIQAVIRRIRNIRAVNIHRAASGGTDASGGGGPAGGVACVKYTSDYSSKRNDWYQFQAHRAVRGVITVGSYRPDSVQESLNRHCELVDPFTATVLDTRCVFVGQGVPTNPGATDSPVHDADCPSSLRREQCLFVMPPSPASIAVNQSSVKSNSATHGLHINDVCSNVNGSDLSVSTTKDDGTSNGHEYCDNYSQLERDIIDFISNIIIVLKSNRIRLEQDVAGRKFDDQRLMLTAPFERRDLVVSDVDSRPYRKRWLARNRKLLADLSLQLGFVREALLLYAEAAESFRALGDLLWLAAVYEGQCAASAGQLLPPFSTELEDTAGASSTAVSGTSSYANKSSAVGLARNQSFPMRARKSNSPLQLLQLAAGHQQQQLYLQDNTASSLSGSTTIATTGICKSLPVDVDPSEVKQFGRELLSLDDIVDRARDANSAYERFSQAIGPHVELNLKLVRLLATFGRWLQATDCLQTAIVINCRLNEVVSSWKLGWYGAVAHLYDQLGCHRKAAFYTRIGAVQAATPTVDGIRPNNALCYRLMVKSLRGYQVDLLAADGGINCVPAGATIGNSAACCGFCCRHGRPWHPFATPTPVRGWARLQTTLLNDVILTADRLSATDGDSKRLAAHHCVYYLSRMFAFLEPSEAHQCAKKLDQLTASHTGTLCLADGVPTKGLLDDDGSDDDTSGGANQLGKEKAHTAEDHCSRAGRYLPPIQLINYPLLTRAKPLPLTFEPIVWRRETVSGIAGSKLASNAASGRVSPVDVTAEGFAGDHTPFIWAPARRGRNGAGCGRIDRCSDRPGGIECGGRFSSRWVKGEVARVELVFENAAPFALQLTNLRLITDGSAFDRYPTSVTIGPASDRSAPTALTVELQGTPREIGDVHVLGYECIVLGVRTRLLFSEASWMHRCMPAGGATLPYPCFGSFSSHRKSKCSLASYHKTNVICASPSQTASATNSVGGDGNFQFVVACVAELPLLEVSGDLCDNSTVTVYSGQRRTYRLKLHNRSSIPVEIIEISVDDGVADLVSSSLTTASGRTKMSAIVGNVSGRYQRSSKFSSKAKKSAAMVEWSDEELAAQLPILPDALAVFHVTLTGNEFFVDKANSGPTSFPTSKAAAAAATTTGGGYGGLLATAAAGAAAAVRTSAAATIVGSSSASMALIGRSSSAAPSPLGTPRQRRFQSTPNTPHRRSATNHTRCGVDSAGAVAVIGTRLVVTYSGGPGLCAGYGRCCTISTRLTILPSVVVTQWDVLLADSSSQCFLVLDLENRTPGDIILEYQDGKTMLVESVCKIPVLIPRCKPATSFSVTKRDHSFSGDSLGFGGGDLRSVTSDNSMGVEDSLFAEDYDESSGISRLELLCRQHIAKHVRLRWSMVAKHNQQQQQPLHLAVGDSTVAVGSVSQMASVQSFSASLQHSGQIGHQQHHMEEICGYANLNECRWTPIQVDTILAASLTCSLSLQGRRVSGTGCNYSGGGGDEFILKMGVPLSIEIEAVNMSLCSLRDLLVSLHVYQDYQNGAIIPHRQRASLRGMIENNTFQRGREASASAVHGTNSNIDFSPDGLAAAGYGSNEDVVCFHGPQRQTIVSIEPGASATVSFCLLFLFVGDFRIEVDCSTLSGDCARAVSSRASLNQQQLPTAAGTALSKEITEVTADAVAGAGHGASEGCAGDSFSNLAQSPHCLWRTPSAVEVTVVDLERDPLLSVPL